VHPLYNSIEERKGNYQAGKRYVVLLQKIKVEKKERISVQILSGGKICIGALNADAAPSAHGSITVIQRR